MHRNTIALMGAGSLLAILTGTTLLASLNTATPMDTLDDSELTPLPPHQVITPQSTDELAQLFEQYNYQWPPKDVAEVPMLVLKSLPTDFPETLDVQERKSLFLRSLLPIVLMENRRLREQRALLMLMIEQKIPEPGSEHYAWLKRVANEMRVRGDLSKPEIQQRLLRRLDEIPLTLALAQAAMESGWGTSRFALEGNSLFGQWTYKSNVGLEPENRDPDANHFVRAFPNLRASVRAYMRNLNTGRAYREFRDTRAEMRATGEDLSPIELAKHLRRYSERGIEYVKELQKIIKGKTLTQLELSPHIRIDSMADISEQMLFGGST